MLLTYSSSLELDNIGQMVCSMFMVASNYMCYHIAHL